MKRIMSFILVFMLILSLAACKPGEVSTNSDQDNQEGNDTLSDVGQQNTPSIKERSKGITFRTYMTSTPITLNGHDTTTADAADIKNYTEIGFYNLIANATGDGYEFATEMAEEFPIDITSKYAGDPKYGIPADKTEHYAYLIKLNKNAKWEDGTPITADDYIYSYSQILNPQMKNVRASEVYTGNLTLANAEAYFKQGVAYDNVSGNDAAKDIPENEWYTSMTEPIVFFGGAASEYYEDYKDSFMTADGRDLYELYSKEPYVLVTEQVKKDLMELAKNFSNPAESWIEFCLIKVERPAMDFSEVGMKKVSDYELEIILGAPTNEFFIKYALTTNWLVHKDLYESNKKDTGGGIIKTTYGNDETKYKSYGPYKITEYIKDKLVVLSMNENWYGWEDGKHEYLMNAETIRFDVIPEHEVAFQMFLKGELDHVGIGTKKDYASSEYLHVAPNKYTYCLNFYSDRNGLKKMETPGINKTMLSYKEFRQAMSLGINRDNFCKARNPLLQPLNALLNDIYITDPDSGQSYRQSEYGKQVLINIYGGTDVDSGYDVAKARELVMKAYEQAKANGDYKDGDVIELLYPTSSETESFKLLVNVLETSVLEILKGTPLEDKFRIKALVTDDWHGKMLTGEGQINFSGGGGGAMEPFGLMEFLLRPGDTYGIDYRNVMLTLTIDGKEITDNCYDWIIRLDTGEFRTADNDLRTMILSKIEERVLQEYAAVPMQASSTIQLMSMRTHYELDKYVPLVSYGQRYFTMTDAEWDEYVKSQGGELDYK